MNHLTEEQLVLYHYGDTDRAEAGAIEEHLHSCAACQAELDGIRRALDAVAMPAPARADGYGADVWTRIQPSLERPTAAWWEGVAALLTPRRLALAGALGVLVVAAFVAGRVAPRDTAVPPSPAATAAGSSASAAPSASAPGAADPAGPVGRAAAAERDLVRERILLVAVGDHLERSQIALVELVNSQAGSTVDISGEQERARDLITESRLYRQAAVTTDEPGVASVLDDLERVLVEIANSPSTLTADEFDQVRKRIEQQGIIFKIRVFGDSVREREYRSVTEAAGIRG